MFNPQLFSETLFGAENETSDLLFMEDHFDLPIEEMGYDDFVQCENERRNKRTMRRNPGALN